MVALGERPDARLRRRARRQPVALLPKSARSYQLVDPATGSRKRVTAEVAASLSVIAYSLYRPFPQRSLGVVDLLRFGLRKGGGDLWMIIVMGVLGGLLALVVPIATGLLSTASSRPVTVAASCRWPSRCCSAWGRSRRSS